ncbi:SHOCT domain-containing protein [Streptomyces sp. uw30]|uniref:SHOCT domain-containing protein n=1 Tax=Streptomyces sp. uw30 TaxID=1828179 RepID=UPI0011CEBF94|nr:SHOCT domain-containing protein [Streptomyces sp. uw30]TXS41001.1 SHOCT domain-containing protein [Streptomyces sp. uw30]
MSTSTYLAYDYPLLSMFWTLLWFFLWIMWFVLLFRIIGDIFRDDSLSGWGKTGWLVFCIVLPFLGVFVYLIARGKDMGRREIEHSQAQQRAFDDYVRDRAGESKPSSSAEELAKLSEMRSHGDITDDEFRRAKDLVLSGAGPSARTGSTTDS